MRLPTLRESSTLQAQELSNASQQAVDELLREGESANTLASYRAALRYWAAWFALRYGVPIALPIPAAAVQQFIVDHAQRTTERGLVHELPRDMDDALIATGIKGKPGPLALNTIVHRIAVLSKVHQLRHLKNPCQDPKVRQLLSMTRRAYAKRGTKPRKQDALTHDPLRALLATCDDSLIGIRDRALLLFAWSTGGRRRSEVAEADMAHLAATENGEFSYLLGLSKTNQAGQERPEDWKPVVGKAATALQRWLHASGVQQGRIFRQVRKGGSLGGELSGWAVRQIVRKRSNRAGTSVIYSAHSLRSGFVTEAGRQGLPLADTMALTGHRSVQTVMGYTRVGANSQRDAARSLLERSGD